jgi:pSer/pThr/pTyr-binding forkhead associated (FHA) protein
MGTPRGTLLNGKRVNARTELTDGDEVRVGAIRLRFESSAAEMPLGELLDGAIPVEKQGYVVLARGEKVRVKATFVMGKGRECNLVLRGWLTPRIAALIVREGDSHMLLNVSPNGGNTAVNGRPVTDRARLAHDDHIEIYGESFRFVYD